METTIALELTTETDDATMLDGHNVIYSIHKMNTTLAFFFSPFTPCYGWPVDDVLLVGCGVCSAKDDCLGLPCRDAIGVKLGELGGGRDQYEETIE
jgi:hypothetical protein